MTLLVYAVLYSILVVTFVVFARRIIRQGPASASNPAFGTAPAGVG
jgi:cytochrome bd-type quinol oxidase subunit 1